jgi:hypothetical protein
MGTKPASVASPIMSDEPSPTAQHSRVAFLGLCDRAAYVREGNTNLFNWNILGLRNVVLSYILPITLDGWFVGFAFRWGNAGTQERFRFSDEGFTKLMNIGSLFSIHSKSVATKSVLCVVL